MASEAGIFTNLEQVRGESVLVGDNECLEVQGKGEIRMKVGSESLVLKDVLLVPGIARNLMSTIAATRHAGTVCLTSGGVATLYRQGRMLVSAKVSKNDGLLTFVAEHNFPMRSALVTEAKESPQLWHRRLNHANVDVLARMQSRELVSGVNVSAEEFRTAKKGTVYEPCQLGEQTCGSHPTSNSICPAPLDLLHIDVLEMPVESRQQFKYLLGVVDDHSRFEYVGGLKTEGAAADSLCSRILRLERQRERQVKIVRSDMRREFLGVDMQGWFKGRGIEHQETAGYASQSNGIAERFLRTLQDGIRALLSKSGLGPKFWCYAAYH
jgi:hypothetical protein